MSTAAAAEPWWKSEGKLQNISAANSRRITAKGSRTGQLSEFNANSRGSSHRAVSDGALAATRSRRRMRTIQMVRVAALTEGISVKIQQFQKIDATNTDLYICVNIDINKPQTRGA